MTPQPRSKYDSGKQASPVLDRLLARSVIDPETGCWLWQGFRDAGGYGRTKIGSRRDGSRRSVLCHVAAYQTKHGPVPDGLTLDHIVCDRPACCNPDHVVPATMWANTRRSLSSPTAVNARKQACPKCGGPYEERSDRRGRRCRPCTLAYLREYNARRSGAPIPM